MVDLLARGRTILGRTEQEAAVSDYLRTGGVNLDPVTKAWCASFVNSTLAQEGLPKAGVDALSFKKYGDPVLTPQPGDIGVFAGHDDPKHTGWQGHAAIATGQTDEYGNPIILSGNANDMVMEHPIESNRLIGWRRPPGIQERAVPLSLMSPAERQVLNKTNLANALSTFNEDRMGRNHAFPNGIGGTITPSIIGGFREQRDRQIAEDKQWEAEQAAARARVEAANTDAPTSTHIQLSTLLGNNRRPALTGANILRGIRAY